MHDLNEIGTEVSTLEMLPEMNMSVPVTNTCEIFNKKALGTLNNSQ